MTNLDCRTPLLLTESTVSGTFSNYLILKWLYHVAKFNPNVKEIVDRNSSKMSKEWKDLTNKDFQETI